jgi:hypothetical protein
VTELPTPARRAILTAQGIALGGALTLAAIAGAGAAQDATPAAECVPPAAAAGMSAMAAATPAADLVATPASEEVAARAQAAAENFVACWNAGDLGAALALVTPNLLQTSFGVADAQAAEAALPELGLGQIEIVEVGDANTYDDGRASIDVGYTRGDYQHVDARWFMVEHDGELMIDQEHLLPPSVEGDKAFISFSVADDESPVGFDQRSEIAPIDVVVLHGVNNGDSARFFTVHKLPAMDGTPMPGEMPEGGEVIGFLAIAPGEQEDLPLAGLEPGVYALTDSAVEGSVATLLIAEPAE